ncbi:MAG: ferritin-like domain-containing protein [Patescibacteria group bacterium]
MSALLPANATLFTPERAEKEAKRARKIEGIYHLGQKAAWDGREVLKRALAEHPAPPGGERIPRREREALARVFSVLMWGELAAWRVAAQLADQVEDMELRMAATSQAHDEARHFYVMHDYLKTLGVRIPPLDKHSRAFLNACIGTNRLVEKVVGMQLFVETIALTIFKMVRQTNLDPALSEVLSYYEKDEARHVGFGVQALPSLVANMGVADRASLWAFEARLLTHTLLSLKDAEQDLRIIGADPRVLLDDGRTRFQRAMEDYRAETDGAANPEAQLLARSYEAAIELAFPAQPNTPFGKRLTSALRMLGKHSDLM